MDIKDKIHGMGEYSGLDFHSAVNICENENIKINDVEISGKNTLGFSSHKEIFLDWDKMVNYSSSDIISLEMILFIIYHEIAHYKRIMKIGVEEHLKMISNKDFNSFSNYIINEEMFADRWAKLMFYKFNRIILADHYMQPLHYPEIRVKYEEKLKRDHKILSSGPEKYQEVLDKYIIKYR